MAVVVAGGGGRSVEPGEAAPLRVRAIRPDDELRLARFHAELSERSVRLRYFADLPLRQRVLHNRLSRVCAADGRSEVVLAALDGPEGDERVLGVGRLSVDLGRGEGEIALLVADAFQGRGIGRELMGRLVALARERRLARLCAFLLPENLPMRRLCLRFGFTAAADGDLVTARLELEPPGDPTPSSPGPPPCVPSPRPRSG